MGLVDEKCVGLIGHSWGGYQAGYAVTQTDIFAASVAGAGLTDFFSMYGMVFWSSGGLPETNHFEAGQERMIAPPWNDIEGYVRNSSVLHVEKLNTPLLFMVGDNDRNVDWRQGIELYNTVRRAGKHMVMLVYANEGHSLRKDENRIDYQRRIGATRSRSVLGSMNDMVHCARHMYDYYQGKYEDIIEEVMVRLNKMPHYCPVVEF